MVYSSWARHKDVVRRVLQSVLSQIHIACDIWTSPNNWLLFGIVAHFTTYDSKHQKALLALKKVPGHSSESMWTILLLVLEDYGIVRQLGAIVADNATTNDVLCRLIQAHFYTMYKMVWKVDEWRICCISHIINLVVQAFLFTKAFTIEELESYN